MTAADNEMILNEESSFQEFSNDEEVTSVITRSNSMILSFIMNTMKNLMNQNSFNVSFWTVINESQNFTNNSHSLIIRVIDLSEQIEQDIVNTSVNIAAEKQINESTISTKAKIIRRKNLLRERMNVSKIIEDITDRKKLRLQDLIRNIKKAIWERNI